MPEKTIGLNPSTYGIQREVIFLTVFFFFLDLEEAAYCHFVARVQQRRNRVSISCNTNRDPPVNSEWTEADVAQITNRTVWMNWFARGR